MNGRLQLLSILSVGAAHGLSACAMPPEVTTAIAGDGRGLEARLDTAVPWLLETHRVPGAAVAVLQDGRMVLARGWGLRRAGEDAPMTEHSVFEAASLGKPVFAYAVMKLVRDGRLDLDRPLSGYLGTAYVEGDERVYRITARHVLSHTSGLPNWRPRHWTDHPGPLGIESDPGKRFRYSGEGYDYLQAVVERITGEPLEGFMMHAVFAPLGMTDSSTTWSGESKSPLAWPHGRWGQPTGKRTWRASAAASLHTSAADLARFLAAMLATSQTPGPDGRRLTAAQLDAMLEAQVEISDRFAWSLGWGLERRAEETLFWQWGDNNTYQHFMAGSRAGRTALVVLTNGAKGAYVYRPVVEMVLGRGLTALTSPAIRY